MLPKRCNQWVGCYMKRDRVEKSTCLMAERLTCVIYELYGQRRGHERTLEQMFVVLFFPLMVCQHKWKLKVFYCIF